MANRNYFIDDPYTGMPIPVTLTMSHYQKKYGGGIAVQMWDDEGPYATLTVNLHPATCKEGCAFVDVNNCGNGIVHWLEENGIAIPTGRWQRSGFVNYPEVRFTPQFLSEVKLDE